jgi:hypothetical protein
MCDICDRHFLFKNSDSTGLLYKVHPTYQPLSFVPERACTSHELCSGSGCGSLAFFHVRVVSRKPKISESDSIQSWIDSD